MKGKPLGRKAWAELKSAYCRGEGSIAELCAQRGISQSTAEKKCAREKWQITRQEVGERAEERAREKDVESVAAMLGKHRASAARVADLALNAIEQLVAKGKLSQAALERYSLILARMAPMERLAAGIERAKPVAGGGDGLKRRVVMRGGANVPAVVPEPAAEKSAPVAKIGKAS